jgi:hypothetical protein
LTFRHVLVAGLFPYFICSCGCGGRSLDTCTDCTTLHIS